MSEEHVTKRIYTTCVEAYDYSQARTIDPMVGRTTNGKVVRLVEITESPYRVEYQINRYKSGLELVATEDEFQKLVECKVIRLKDALVERTTNPALVGG